MNLWKNIKTWIKKRKYIFIEFSSILSWIIIGIIALLLYVFNLLDLLTLLKVLLGLLVAFLPLYLHLIKKRDQVILISFTSKYLLRKEEAVDELLGILITGRWEKLKTDPIEEFFNCLKRICEEGSVEMRRRIAEALPALFRIDLERSKGIVEILRKDWDERFKSDNRRRTIEALSYIADIERDFVKENLQIIDGDEVFVIIAITEVLDVWRRKINKKEAENLFKNLMMEMKERGYHEEEIVAVSELWNLLHIIHSNPSQAIRRIEELKRTSNIYIQVGIVRNLKYFKNFPLIVLNLIEYFIQEDKNKHVRRAVAKEDSVEYLISLLHDKQFSEKAKSIILKLINDRDETIRIATFDRIERILDIDIEFGRKILQNIIDKNQHPELIKRAKRVLERTRS